MPASQRLLTISIRSKPTGDFRPIGQQRGQFHVWAILRRIHVQGWQNGKKPTTQQLQSHFEARRSGGRLSGQRVRIPAGAARICKLARYATHGAGCASPFERTVASENSGDPVFPSDRPVAGCACDTTSSDDRGGHEMKASSRC